MNERYVIGVDRHPRIFPCCSSARIRDFAGRTSRRRDVIGSLGIRPFALPNRRTRDRRSPADSRSARRQRRSRDKDVVTLRRSRTAGHANACKGIDVGIRPCETVCKCLEEGNDLVLLHIRQAKIARRHVEIVLDLGHRPAVYFFSRSCRAVSGSDREGKFVARVVEMDELLQALDVAVMKELFLEVGPGCLGGRTLWRCHRHIARRHYLLLAVDTRPKWYPILVRVGRGTEATSQERP